MFFAASGVPSPKLVSSTSFRSLSMCTSIPQLSINFIKTSASAMERSLLLRFSRTQGSKWKSQRMSITPTSALGGEGSTCHLFANRGSRSRPSQLVQKKAIFPLVVLQMAKKSLQLSCAPVSFNAQSVPKAETPSWARHCKSSNNTNGVVAPRPALNRIAEFGRVGFDHHCHHRVVKRLPCEASWSSSTSHSHSS